VKLQKRVQAAERRSRDELASKEEKGPFEARGRAARREEEADQRSAERGPSETRGRAARREEEADQRSAERGPSEARGRAARREEEADAGAGTPREGVAAEKKYRDEVESEEEASGQDFFATTEKLGDSFRAKRGALAEKLSYRPKPHRQVGQPSRAMSPRPSLPSRAMSPAPAPTRSMSAVDLSAMPNSSRGLSPGLARTMSPGADVRGDRRTSKDEKLPFGRKPGQPVQPKGVVQYTETATKYNALPEVRKLHEVRNKKAEFLKRRELTKQLDAKLRARRKALQGDSGPSVVNQPPMVYGNY